MYKKLQFKIVLIIVSFIVLVMTAVGSILISNVFSYYSKDFTRQMKDVFTDEFVNEIGGQLKYEDFADRAKNTVRAYSGQLGIDSYRDYYILDSNGNFLSGSTEESKNIKKTSNLMKAISGTSSGNQSVGYGVMDWAEVISSPKGDKSAIIYIVDSEEELHEFSFMIFSIMLQSLLIGLAIAIILSIFLSRAIISPIRNITNKATRVAEGDFGENLEVYSDDEIGVLTETFNKMSNEIQSNLSEISGEREKLETIFYYLKDAVIAFDNLGNTMHVNPTAKELFGNDSITLSELIDRLCLEERIDDISHDENRTVSLSNVSFNEKTFDMNIGKFNFIIHNESFGGYIIVLHDVTERFELEKSRREFIANVSHELGTPLTAIKGAAETIVTNEEIPKTIENHFLDMIIDESDRMSHIVKDLLVLSRLDNNRMQWKASEFDLSALIERCREILNTEAVNAGHTLKFIKNGDINAIINADSEKIEQVLINIIHNSIKYTQAGGNIFVTLDKNDIKNSNIVKDGSYYTIRITDNGPGIPKEDLPRIFERFYRVEKARNSDKGGTGLGLAISKEIAVGHGGNIDIESTLGHGTTLIIYLPEKAEFIK